jgi:hypothetical protein
LPAPSCWLFTLMPLLGFAAKSALKSMIVRAVVLTPGKPNTLIDLTSLPVSAITRSCESLAVDWGDEAKPTTARHSALGETAGHRAPQTCHPVPGLAFFRFTRAAQRPRRRS